MRRALLRSPAAHISIHSAGLHVVLKSPIRQYRHVVCVGGTIAKCLKCGSAEYQLNKVIGCGSNCTPMRRLCFTAPKSVIMIPVYDLFFISRNLER